RGDPPGRAVERPAGRARPRADLRHQPDGLRPAGQAGEGRGRAPLPVRVHLLGVRGLGRRRAAGRGRAAAAGHPVRGVQGTGRGRAVGASRRGLLPGEHAQRHRVRLLAPAPGRHRAQQPGRARPPDRRGAGAVGRHALAAPGARGRHRRGVRRRPGRAARGGARPGVQRRRRAEQPDRRRDRRARGGGGARRRAAHHRGKRGGSSLVPGGLLPHQGRAARVPRPVDRQGGGGRAGRGLPAARAHRGRLRAALHPAGPARRPPRRRHRGPGAARVTGEEMHALVERLYPICRSITGDGVRRTLEIVGEHLPLDVHEVPTGTPVLDWAVPKEWNIRDAYIKDPSGRRVVDFRRLNLHVVGYSVPVRGTYTLEELRPRLHTLPDQPGLVPYRTSYYSETWGFCLSQKTLDGLDEGPYEVLIDSTLAGGHLTYAEHVVHGDSDEEVLISCHVCHPSLANDNLAGIAVAVALAARLESPRFTYRFVFAPGTIGAITWLARNRDRVGRIRAGLTLACAGDPGPLTYKRSRRGDAGIDRVLAHVLAGRPHTILDFSPYGYDERQYCSPGFDLPVGSLTRTPYAGYPEYHTS